MRSIPALSLALVALLCVSCGGGGGGPAARAPGKKTLPFENVVHGVELQPGVQVATPANGLTLVARAGNRLTYSVADGKAPPKVGDVILGEDANGTYLLRVESIDNSPAAAGLITFVMKKLDGLWQAFKELDIELRFDSRDLPVWRVDLSGKTLFEKGPVSITLQPGSEMAIEPRIGGRISVKSQTASLRYEFDLLLDLKPKLTVAGELGVAPLKAASTAGTVMHEQGRSHSVLRDRGSGCRTRSPPRSLD